MYSFLAIIPVLMALVSAQASPKSSCTLTETHHPGCCPPVSRFTATEYSDCSGCALTTVTNGPRCDIICPTTQTVDATTTKTACATCTSTLTKNVPGCPGCTTTVYATTSTVRTNCHGCALTTATHTGVGVCHPVCPTTSLTTTVPSATTVTVCSASV